MLAKPVYDTQVILGKYTLATTGSIVEYNLNVSNQEHTNANNR